MVAHLAVSLVSLTVVLSDVHSVVYWAVKKGGLQAEKRDLL